MKLSKRQIILLVVLITTILILACCAIAVTAYIIALQPVTTTISTPVENIVLHCPDCAAEGILINIWEAPGLSPVVCQHPHGTSAVLIETVTIDDKAYSHVRIPGECEGWLSSALVRPK